MNFIKKIVLFTLPVVLAIMIIRVSFGLHPFISFKRILLSLQDIDFTFNLNSFSEFGYKMQQLIVSRPSGNFSGFRAIFEWVKYLATFVPNALFNLFSLLKGIVVFALDFLNIIISIIKALFGVFTT